jgi:hypothetical protein
MHLQVGGNLIQTSQDAGAGRELNMELGNGEHVNSYQKLRSLSHLLQSW